MKHLVLIDGHHLMYRAYWAIPRTLQTSAGEQSNAVFGVASMILTILKSEEPDALVFCFDEGSETFRHQEAKDYKAGRAETPDDFYEQIPRILQCVRTFSFASVSNPLYEADDYLGAYAKAAEAASMRVTIVTGDRDALQLASDKTRIAIPHKGYGQAEYLGPEEIEAKYSVRPDQIVDYKGLIGDSSDNLPGVKGIGPKTAVELLQKYETLEGIYAHIEKIRPSVREKLSRDREQAFFCQRMSALVCDIPLPVTLDDAAFTDIDPDQIAAFFKEMDFTLLTKRFQVLLASEFGKRAFLESKELTPVEEPKEQMTLL